MKECEEAGKKRLLQELASLTLEFLPRPGLEESGIKSLFFARLEDRAVSRHCLEQPKASLIIQGAKKIDCGLHEFEMHGGDCLVTCVDTPSSSRLLDASPRHPFLSIFFQLDREILADLLARMPPRKAPPECQAARVMPASYEFMESLLRLARLLKKPERIPVLAPLLLRELHYFLLISPQGPILRELYPGEARDGNIVKAIAILKRDIAGSIPARELARKANMSVSSLYRHFKALTGYSPLQFHKRLKLYEAQRLMLLENERADMAALAVGYESVTQFNREYKRLFGEPPRRDISRRKKNLD